MTDQEVLAKWNQYWDDKFKEMNRCHSGTTQSGRSRTGVLAAANKKWKRAQPPCAFRVKLSERWRQEHFNTVSAKWNFLNSAEWLNNIFTHPNSSWFSLFPTIGIWDMERKWLPLRNLWRSRNDIIPNTDSNTAEVEWSRDAVWLSLPQRWKVRPDDSLAVLISKIPSTITELL